MSRAFVKEGQESSAAELPDRLVSPHPNYVTIEGLEQIETEVARLSEAYAAAQSSADRDALAVIARDLRYWTARRTSAELVHPAKGTGVARFGSTVSLTMSKPDGAHERKSQTFRIVGEDEAEPSHGTLSYVSPMARALMGKSAGDTVRLPAGGEVKLIAIE